MIFIPYIIENMGSWVRPGDIGALFHTFSSNFDMALVSNSTFIRSSSGRLSSN